MTWSATWDFEKGAMSERQLSLSRHMKIPEAHLSWGVSLQ